MPTIAHTHLPPPKSWDEFEDIVCSIAKIRWKNPDFTRHGRQGQKQDGVDVFGYTQNGDLVGLQCKNTLGVITEAIIQSELDKAVSFQPKIHSLYIITTAATDANLQKFVRLLSADRKENELFGMNILFWNDVAHDLTLDERYLYQHYPQLKPLEKSADNIPSHDLRIFHEFQQIFPHAPAVQLLREHDFGAPFLRKSIQPLFDFVETWNQPQKEFLDKELQQALYDLYQAACSMSSHLEEKTVPIGNFEFASVFSDLLRQAGPRPDWVKVETRVLNEQATVFVAIYEDFYRLCRKKLEK